MWTRLRGFVGSILFAVVRLTLTIGGMLETRDLQDFKRNTGYSFGVTGLDKLFGGGGSTPPATGPPTSGPADPNAPKPEGPKPGGSSVIGGVTLTYNNFAAEGTTFTVIGQGEITVGGVKNPDVLGTVKRDLDGRQIMTVTDKTNFSLDIPLVNAQQLAENAKSALDLIKAITTPVPAEVKALGLASTDYFQRLIANGLTTEEAKAEFDKLGKDYEIICVNLERRWPLREGTFSTILAKSYSVAH